MGDLDDSALGIAVHEQVRAAVEEHGAADLVAPVIVVRDTSQAGFDAANDERHIAICFSCALAVNDHRAVGAFSTDIPRRIGVVIAPLPISGVSIDHRIHVAGGNTEEQVGAAKGSERLGTVPGWLGNDAHAKSLRFQHAPDDGHAEAGVVHVCVAGDQNDVTAVPAQRIHLGPAHRQFRGGSETFGPVLAIGV